jgi:hypothetical protein
MHSMKDKAAALKAIMSLSKLTPPAREAAIRNEAIRRGKIPSDSTTEPVTSETP